MMNDPLSNALSVMMNAETRRMKTCKITPVSKTIARVITLMNETGYIGEPKTTETSRGDILNVPLIGSINKCGSIKPRYTVKKDDFEKFEKKYLPAKDFGYMIVSTSQGIMTHLEAKQKSLGGKLLAYYY